MENVFDFIKIMFSNRNEYDKVSKKYKQRHFWMIQRFMSIRYPDKANYFNLYGINQENVIDNWTNFTLKQGRIPSWFYTKINKKEKETKKNKQYVPSDSAKNLLLKKFKWSLKDYEDYEKVNKENLYDILNNFEFNIETNGKTGKNEK